MLQTERFNLNIKAGATYKLPINVSLDLTGYVIRSQFKRGYGQTTAALSLTDSNGGFTVEDRAAGEITMSVTPAQTTLLSGNYFYDVEIDDGTDVYRILEGDITVSPEVTT